MNTEYGDETELEIIIDAGTREAMDFGAHWLNPPHKIVPDAWYDFVIYHPEDFIEIKP